MPLQLVDYNAILGNPKKIRLPVGKNKYDEFGANIVSILQTNSQRDGIHECEFMADLRKMGRLLGDQYELVTVSKGRGFQKVKLREMIVARRITCVLDGTYRYIGVIQKQLP